MEALGVAEYTLLMAKKFKTFLGISILGNLILAGSLLYLVQRLGGVKFMLHRISAGGLAGVYENRKNLFDHLQMEKGSIVFLGDSITEYGQWEELLQNPSVKNRGIAGDTTWGLLRRLSTITNTQPQAIFLMIGINDFLFTDRAEIIQNYTKIIQQIKSETPNSQLFIQSVLPINPNVKNTVFNNQEIVLLNESIQVLAQNEGLIYLDIYKLLKDEKGALAAKFTADGVHINGAAYSIWKDAVNPYILALAPK